MQDIRALDRAALDRIRFVLTDIDDTVTTEGRLPAAAYDALERLQQAGLAVIPITGRPAGWCDMIARFWPVDAVVGENGAFYFSYDRKTLTMKRTYFASVAERAANRARLEAIRAKVLAEVPGAAIASDQAYREADLAIDFCEDVPALAQGAIDRIVEIFHAAGAQAKVSSIHVNGWFGRYDKLSMTRVMMKEKFAVDLDAARDVVAFVGDSPNDETMFAFFPVSIGVANVTDALHRFKSLPAYVTHGRGGAGFVEFADLLIASRSGGSPAVTVRGSLMSSHPIRLGMLTPSSNTVLEPLAADMVSGLPNVSVHFSRFKVTEIALSASALNQFNDTEILRAASLLADAKVDVISWIGTSASWLGFERDEKLVERLREATGVKACTCVLAFRELFQKFGVKRVGLVTPYTSDVQQRIASVWSAAGFNCDVESHLGIRDNFAFGEVTSAQIETMIRDVAKRGAEAVAVVCTNLRGAPLVPHLEAELGIPIFDSVAVTVWKCLLETGLPIGPLEKWGRVFRPL